MKQHLTFSLLFCTLLCTGFNCGKKTNDNTPVGTDSSYVNLSHLNHLYTPVNFPGEGDEAGIYIYAEAPDYHVVEAVGEGYTCVDDVARAAQVYLRSTKFETDTSIQNKAYNVLRFLLEMQSPNGYFYNFVYSNGLINKFGITSVNNANWWSWRALVTLTEALPIVQSRNPALYSRIQTTIANLVVIIKSDLVNIPATTHINQGITVPEWLPAGSGTDQAALLIIGLTANPATANDPIIKAYVRKLADGISLMQHGDATKFPWSCILSWENTWHAYGCDQALSLFKAAVYLQDTSYSNKAIAEVKNFYPKLLQNGFKSSFTVQRNGDNYQLLGENSYEQIAYGIRPMVSAAIEAYQLTGQDTYSDIAGRLAAWFLGANEANLTIYDKTTGRCFDAISGSGQINRNSGAESTIEALLTMQKVEAIPAVYSAMLRYKR